MIGSARHTNDDMLYTVFKKHKCPLCNSRVNRVKSVKTISAKSFEAKKYSIDPYIIGDVRIVTVEFFCPKCQKSISIEDMKKFEGLIPKEESVTK